MDNFGIGIMLILSVVFMAPYMYTQFSARRAVGKVTPAYEHLLSDDTDPSQTLYFYFMTDNCPMCTAMSPLIKKIQRDNPNVIYVNLRDSAKFARDFHVYGTPSLLAVNNHIINAVKLGGLNEKKLSLFITDNLQ